jgi:hypothetical protein
MNQRAFLQTLALCGSVTPVAEVTTLLGDPLQLSGLTGNAPRHVSPTWKHSSSAPQSEQIGFLFAC